MLNSSKRINGITYYARFGLIFIGGNLLLGLAWLFEYLLGEDNKVNSFVLGPIILLFAFFCLAVWFITVRQRANDISGKHPLLYVLLLLLTPVFYVGGLFPGEKIPNKYGKAPTSGIHLGKPFGSQNSPKA